MPSRRRAPALVLDPDNEDMLTLEATLLDDLAETEESLRAYRDLLARHPDSYLGYVNLGITLSRLERWEEAEQALLRAGEPNESVVHRRSYSPASASSGIE